MGNTLFASNDDSDVDQRTHGDSDTPKVDNLERAFVNDLFKRLKAIEDEFRKCMVEVRQMEKGQSRCEKNVEELTRKNRKLENEKQKMYEFNQQLKREVKNLEILKEEHKNEIDCLQSVKVQEHKEFVLLERTNQEQEQKIAELKKKLSASRDARMRSRDIRPGDVTHDHVKADFADYFNTSRSFFRPLGINNQPDKRSQLLINILQVAFSVCQDEALQVLSDELKSILVPPKEPVLREFSDKKQVPEEGRYRCEAFSILLSLSKIDPHEQPPKITELVKQNLEEVEPVRAFMSQSAETVDKLIVKAAKLAWQMVTLVPPAILGTPDIQADHLQTLAHSSIESGDSKIVYRKPILFFSAWGDVGEKGEIKLVSDQEDLAQQSKSIPCKAVEKKEGISLDPERSLGTDGSKFTTMEASTTPCEQIVGPDKHQCEESPSIPVDHEVGQHAEPCAVQSLEMPTQQHKNLALSESPPTASPLNDACLVSVSRIGTGNLSQLDNTSKTKQNSDLQVSISNEATKISNGPTKDESSRSTMQPHSVEDSTDGDQGRPALEKLSLQGSSNSPSPSHLTPATETPPSDKTCSSGFNTLQAQNSAPGNGSLEGESNSLVDNTFKEQDTALTEETAKKRKQSYPMSLSEDKGTALRAEKPYQQQGSTECHQLMSDPRSLAEECEQATEQARGQETVRNDPVSGLGQVFKADGWRHVEKKAETTTEVLPVHQECGTACPTSIKTIGHKKACQPSDCVGEQSNNQQDAAIPTSGTSVPCFQRIEVDNNINEGSNIEKEDKTTGLAEHVPTEHSSQKPPSMEPASGKKMSLSDTCSSKRSDLSSQNGSDNEYGGKQPARRRQERKRGGKRSRHAPAKPGNPSYPCPAPLSEASITRTFEGTTHSEAKTTSPDLSSLSNTPVTDLLGELSDPD